METLDSYNPKEMSGEKGALDCWDFQVNPEFLEEIISPCLNSISYEDWMSLDTNSSESEIFILLSDMCDIVTSTGSSLILEAVEPLIITSGHDLSSDDDVTVQGGCRNFKMMEEDIEVCFGKSLYQYFVEALDIPEESFDTLDELVRLFSAEVTKKVNSSLAQATGSTLSLNTCDSLKAEFTLQMVDTIGKLFREVHKSTDGSCDELVCSRYKFQKCWSFDSEDAENVEQDSTEISRLRKDLSELPKVLDLNPDYLINKTFLTVILAKLVDHIATKTRTSLENVDLDQLVYSLIGLTKGMLDFTLLQSVDSLHISMYKNLCQKFRSKYVLQAVMASNDEAFDLAVSETLISELKKYNTSKNRWKPFNPSNLSTVFESPEPDGEESSGKGSPVIESPTPEPHREERSKKTMPSRPKRSLSRTLRKTFSRWASNVVNFFKRPGQ